MKGLAERRVQCHTFSQANGISVSRATLAIWRDHGGGGGEDFFCSSVLVTVPSGDCVTVFSFDSTVPSLLTFSLSVFEMVRSHPIVTRASARADITANSAFLRVFMVLLCYSSPLLPNFRHRGYLRNQIRQRRVFCHGGKPVTHLLQWESEMTLLCPQQGNDLAIQLIQFGGEIRELLGAPGLRFICGND